MSNIRHATISVEGILAVHDEPLPYERLSSLVEGWIEAVPLRDGTLWLNEEGELGKNNGMNGDPWPVNPVATALCHANESIWDSDWIAGPVCITGGVDEEGETVGISPELEAYLRDFVLANGGVEPPPQAERDAQALDLLSAWLTFPAADEQWRSAADFIEFAASQLELTGRPTDPTPICETCGSEGEPPSWHLPTCPDHPSNH